MIQRSRFKNWIKIKGILHTLAELFGTVIRTKKKTHLIRGQQKTRVFSMFDFFFDEFRVFFIAKNQCNALQHIFYKNFAILMLEWICCVQWMWFILQLNHNNLPQTGSAEKFKGCRRAFPYDSACRSHNFSPIHSLMHGWRFICFDVESDLSLKIQNKNKQFSNLEKFTLQHVHQQRYLTDRRVCVCERTILVAARVVISRSGCQW